MTFGAGCAGPGSVLIFAEPMTGGAVTPNAASSPSPVYPAGSGAGSASFTLNSGLAAVDAIRFQMWDAGHTTMLFGAVIPVHYQFGTAQRLYLPALLQ